MFYHKCICFFALVYLSQAATLPVTSLNALPLPSTKQQLNTVSPHIVNGTSTTIQLQSNSYIYCSINDSSVEDLHLYRVIWTDPCGTRIQHWKKNSAYSVVGGSVHQPYAYLMFNQFQQQSAGVYTCELWRLNSKINSSSISVTPKVTPARRDGNRNKLRHSCWEKSNRRQRRGQLSLHPYH